MSSYVFPNNILGLGWSIVRTPVWKTNVQTALSGKTSTVAYQQYPMLHFELNYDVLRDDLSTSDLKAVVGLFNAVQGRADSFLFTDPDFNYVNENVFATYVSGTSAYQLVATYQNPGGPGYQEIIQNLNGTPVLYVSRYGNVGAVELLSAGTRTNLCLESNSFSTTWTNSNITLTSGQSSSTLDGGSNAWQFNEGTASGTHLIQQSGIAITPSDQYSFSLYLKRNNCQYMQLTVANGAGINTFSAIFDLVNSVVVSQSATGAGAVSSSVITNFSLDYWDRVQVTGLLGAADSSATVTIQLLSSAQAASYTGTSRYIWIFGAQFEQNQYPTAYIPTTTISVNNGGSDYSIGNTGIVTLANTWSNGALFMWSGNFYYRCRFDTDKLDLSKFMNQWWKGSKISFTQVKL